MNYTVRGTLNWIIQNRSKVSWPSLESRSSRLEPPFSKLSRIESEVSMIEDQVSNFKSRNTMNLSWTHSKNYVPLRETRLLSFKWSSCFESEKCQKKFYVKTLLLEPRNSKRLSFETRGSSVNLLFNGNEKSNHRGGLRGTCWKIFTCMHGLSTGYALALRMGKIHWRYN